MTIRQIGFCTSAFKHILSSQINGVAGTDWARYVLENKNFNVGVAIALFRSPKVAPELNNIEKRFQTLCDEIEAEQSFKNDFELRLETDKV